VKLTASDYQAYYIIRDCPVATTLTTIYRADVL